jgi:hypothetical protein
MPIARLFAVLFALAASTASAAEPPSPRARVMVVGLFHFANPGRDMFNVHMDDVLAERRQAELARVAEGLARFAPDAVMVEWPQSASDERYAAYRAGTLEPSRNEVVQLGFRLAERMELERVHGIDADGEFPFEPVKKFADAHGQGAQLDAALAGIGQEVQALNRRIEQGSIGAVLRYMNTPERTLRNHGFYIDMLHYGEGDEQPGAALASAWYARNLTICARLLQALPPGGKAVVFYGEGHAHLLRQCVVEAPGVELVEAGDYLVE